MSVQTIYKKLDEKTGLLYAWFLALHSRIDIILHTEFGKEELTPIFDNIYNEVERIEKLGNFFDETSELYRINKTAHLHPVEIDNELLSIISDCIEYKKETNGYFDISIHSDNHSMDTLNQVELSMDECTIFYKEEGIKLNLSGYLKGYVLDKIVEILQKNSLSNGVINVGNSSVFAMGNHPYGKGWKVSGKTNTVEIILYNECLTTSGNEHTDRKHIINPVTGKYTEGKKQISVITKTGKEGEVLSTAFFAAEPVQQIMLQNKFNIKTYPI